MRRALLWLVLLVIGVGGALYLHRVGGRVEIEVGKHLIGMSFPVALILLAALFAALHFLFFGIGALRRLPEKLRIRKGLQRRQDGDQAMTRALVALAAGTGDSARQEMRKARTLLGETPQVLWLTAEAERLAGREDAAADAYRLLANRTDSRILGVRGLFRQAMQKGDFEDAQALAAEAAKLQPRATWLREERAQLALKTNDWRTALSLAPAQGQGKKAALALAAAAEEAEPSKAAELERQAFETDKGFAPAAIAYAARLDESGMPRRAKAVLEEAWGASPHPDLAPAYLADEPDAQARLKAVEQLIRRNPTDPESRLLLARTALAAGLTGRARAALQALSLSGDADKRCFVALAEVEAAEQANPADSQAAQAKWLREAAQAPDAPHWRCGHCGKQHQAWTPICDNCGTLGEIAWE
jgi:HemY protein